MWDIFSRFGSRGLRRHPYTNGDARANEYGFANKHRATNCDADTDEHARTDEHGDSNSNAATDYNKPIGQTVGN